MNSHKKLKLSKETLRCLTSDQLTDVQGGANASYNTCLECVTTIVAPTLIDTGCWATR